MQTEDRPLLQIVVAEDNRADVELVRMALRDAGLNCEVRIVEDGEQVIALLDAADGDPAATGIDLLLLDMHLPRRDGADVLTRLRSTQRFAQTRVIVMTSSQAPQIYQIAERHGAIHYFRKPPSLSEFMQLGVIVRDLFPRKPTMEEKRGEPQSTRGSVA